MPFAILAYQYPTLSNLAGLTDQNSNRSGRELPQIQFPELGAASMDFDPCFIMVSCPHHFHLVHHKCHAYHLPSLDHPLLGTYFMFAFTLVGRHLTRHLMIAVIPVSLRSFCPGDFEVRFDFEPI